MAKALDAREFQARLERLDDLLREAAHFADPEARSCVQEIVQTVLEMHGAGLERVLEHAVKADARILDDCVRDDLVSGLLLLHGLHPLGVEERVTQALESVRPYLRSHGGNVELLGVADGTVRLQLHGSCHHCSSSQVTMQQTIEVAIYGKAPEVTTIAIEGLPEEHAAAPQEEGRIALPLL